MFMKLFTQLFVCITFCIILLQSCHLMNNYTVGNSHMVNYEIEIDDYEDITIRVAADVIYENKSWKAPYLQIYMDDNLLPLLDIQVVNRKLVVQTKDNQQIRPTQFKIYTNSTSISNVQLSGSGSIYMKGEVNGDKVTVGISGSGELITDSLYCNTFALNISGSGKAKLEGVSNKTSIEISGSGKIHAYSFRVADLSCLISGSGKMEVFAHQSLKAKISGSGNISYKGEPRQVDQRVSGSGRITSVSSKTF